LGGILLGNKIIPENLRLAFLFLEVWFEEYVIPVSELSTEGIESGEILAQRHPVERGGP
jgi:hypothetical protein